MTGPLTLPFEFHRLYRLSCVFAVGSFNNRKQGLASKRRQNFSSDDDDDDDFIERQYL